VSSFNRLLGALVILMLAAVLLFSGVDKLLHYQGFVNALRDYVVLPRPVAPVLAPLVIAVELVAGLGLLLKPWRRPAALTATLAMLAFTVALALNHLFGGRGVCGCWFTLTLAKGTGMHIVQNLVLAGLAAVTWWEARTGPDPASEARSAATGPGVVPGQHRT